MQIRNPVVIDTLDGSTRLFQHDTRSLVIQQYAASLSNQPQGPPCHQNGTDYAHGRIHPVQSQELSCKQGEDCQQRCQCIRQDVKIGSSEIVIRMRVAMLAWICPLVVMAMVMVVVVVMIVVVMMTAQHDHAGTIDNQAQYRNDNCLIEGNLNRIV